MKTYIIKQKMSGTGTIHDIASQFYDREIKFRKGCEYAIVWASFYGDIYKTFKTAEACAKAASKIDDSVTIIDSDGNSYYVYNRTLYRDDYY